MKAWVKQDPKQVRKVGTEKASWYVEWIDPDGNRCCKSHGPGDEGKAKAERAQIIISDQLENGAYKSNRKKTWADFRQEWEEKIGSTMSAATLRLTKDALRQFERIINPNSHAR